MPTVPFDEALRNLESGGLKGSQLEAAKVNLERGFEVNPFVPKATEPTSNPTPVETTTPPPRVPRVVSQPEPTIPEARSFGEIEEELSPC